MILTIVAILVVFQAMQTLPLRNIEKETANDDSTRLSSSSHYHNQNQNQTVNHPSETIHKMPASPNAYVFMLWRCQPEPNSPQQPYYRGYLSNICIASVLLRRFGSTADILLVVQLSANSTQSTLHPDEINLLRRCDVSLRYLPKESSSLRDGETNYNNTFATMFHKFHVYSLVEYEKIFYLDSDILPINNLDYMFDMMDEPATGTVKAITIGGLFQPANGGFFLIRPNITDYQEIQRIILKQGARLGEQESFDPVYGWGHKMGPMDQWETNHPRTKGVMWNFVSCCLWFPTKRSHDVALTLFTLLLFYYHYNNKIVGRPWRSGLFVLLHKVRVEKCDANSVSQDSNLWTVVK
jgi:hypothetical protein